MRRSFIQYLLSKPLLFLAWLFLAGMAYGAYQDEVYIMVWFVAMCFVASIVASVMNYLNHG